MALDLLDVRFHLQHANLNCRFHVHEEATNYVPHCQTRDELTTLLHRLVEAEILR